MTGVDRNPRPVARPAKKKLTRWIIALAVVDVIVIAFVIIGFVNGFPWEDDDPAGTNPSMTETGQPTQPIQTGSHTRGPQLSWERFFLLTQQALPTLTGIEAPWTYRFDDNAPRDNFTSCQAMESMLPTLLAWGENGRWNETNFRLLLFDTEASAHTVKEAAASCDYWVLHPPVILDEDIKERAGVTLYSLSLRQDLPDSRVDFTSVTVAVYGNVVLWTYPNSRPDEQQLAAWENEFVFGFFPDVVDDVA